MDDETGTTGERWTNLVPPPLRPLWRLGRDAVIGSLLTVGALARLAIRLDRILTEVEELLPGAVALLEDAAVLRQSVAPALVSRLEDLAPVVDRLPTLVDDLSRELTAVGALSDPEYGMAAVASNTHHMVKLFEDLNQQLAAIPGASLLRRRNGKVD